MTRGQLVDLIMDTDLAESETEADDVMKVMVGGETYRYSSLGYRLEFEEVTNNEGKLRYRIKKY